MKKTAIKAFALLAASAAALLVTGQLISAGTAQAEEPGQSAAAEVSEQAPKYVLRSWEGKVSLFAGADIGVPAVQTDIEVSGLRAYDRQLLENGIEAASYEDVLRLLEDFDS